MVAFTSNLLLISKTHPVPLHGCFLRYSPCAAHSAWCPSIIISHVFPKENRWNLSTGGLWIMWIMWILASFIHGKTVENGRFSFKYKEFEIVRIYFM